LLGVLALASTLVLFSLNWGHNEDNRAKEKALYETSKRLYDGRTFAFKISQKGGDSSLNLTYSLSGEAEQPFRPLVKVSVKSCLSGVVRDLDMLLGHVMVLVNGSTMTPPTKFIITNLRVIGPGSGQEQVSISFDDAEKMGGKVPDFAQCPAHTAGVGVQSA
jgi:hypothetical protein